MYLILNKEHFTVADPDLELRGGGGGGPFTCPAGFSLSNSVISSFFTQNKGGGGGGVGPSFFP